MTYLWSSARCVICERREERNAPGAESGVMARNSGHYKRVEVAVAVAAAAASICSRINALIGKRCLFLTEKKRSETREREWGWKANEEGGELEGSRKLRKVREKESGGCSKNPHKLRGSRASVVRPRPPTFLIAPGVLRCQLSRSRRRRRRVSLSLVHVHAGCTRVEQEYPKVFWTLSRTLCFQSITTDPRKGRFRFLLAFIE